MRDTSPNEIEAVVEKHTVRVMPKQERVRERRTRDFHERPKKREEPQEEHHPVRATEQITSQIKTGRMEMSFKPKQNQLNFEIENIEPNVVEDEEVPKLDEAVFTLGSKEGEYRKKYQKLVIKYQEIKEMLQQQRKSKNYELN